MYCVKKVVPTWGDFSHMLNLNTDIVGHSEALMLKFLHPEPTLAQLREMPAAEYRRLFTDVKAYINECVAQDGQMLSALPGSVQ